MAYPTIEQYQTALQFPNTAFTDPQLASGKIRASNLGLPLVASGGFALTYALETGGKTLAVRCFHREAKGIELRYAAISNKLSALGSSYFVKFEFQKCGFRLNKALYPLVKMAWAEGETLGQFVEANYQDPAKLSNLVAALSQLAAYLESQGIAHGDIQEGNLMVADQGRKLQLIDYDGMFVPEVASLGGSELGHRDYQHPKRGTSHFGPRLDRFSFIALNLSLRALCSNATLWYESQSGAGVILCRANDFAAPGQSKILQAIARVPGLERDAKNFVAICASEFASTPSLADFLAGRNIPATSVSISTAVAPALGYISQYPVLDAANYAVFHKYIGSMVELVGKIVEVSEKRTRHGRPYIFINFAPWKGKAVKISLWSTALKGEPNTPSAAWAGRWITIRGLVEPVYTNSRYGYEHISITANAVNQISQLTEQEAKYRLTPRQVAPVVSATRNDAALAMLIAARPTSSNIAKPAAQPRPVSNHTSSQSLGQVSPPKPSAFSMTANQATLERMRKESNFAQAPAPSASSTQRPTPQTPKRPMAPSQQHSIRNQPTKKKGFVSWLINFFS